MTLMVTILTCESTYKAEDAVDELSTTIQILLESNRLIAERLASIETGIGIDPSIIHLPDLALKAEPENVIRNAAGFASEEELEQPWVYKRSIVRDPGGGAFSCKALPLYAFDVGNSQLYQFGQFDESHEDRLAPDRTILTTAMDDTSKKRNIQNSSGQDSGNIFVQGLKDARPRTYGTATPSPYANVAISLFDAEGRNYIYGYVPIVVAKCGVFLKERGREVENIIYTSGSAKRVQELQAVFGRSDRYGMKFVWAGYTVHDAASLVLRFLKTSKEPVIPYDHYEPFISCLKSDLGTEKKTSIVEFQQCVISLPPSNRHLLLYLLDLLAVFAEKSENKPHDILTLGRSVPTELAVERATDNDSRGS
ncbi:hypothetical protein ONS95_007139 [Cadophora gregata]|uniref:uncharacterized protein n=1 Tax=Cadophora gregata TaxID=51156 RepID=UPI0026DAEDA0|nr:uncharacterized protein ONS95_007139 [Cadophora gregata]KAK0100687.1 hypothetical protein ONS95_007139 [Cadophora gregata]